MDPRLPGSLRGLRRAAQARLGAGVGDWEERARADARRRTRGAAPSTSTWTRPAPWPCRRSGAGEPREPRPTAGGAARRPCADRPRHLAGHAVREGARLAVTVGPASRISLCVAFGPGRRAAGPDGLRAARAWSCRTAARSGSRRAASWRSPRARAGRGGWSSCRTSTTWSALFEGGAVINLKRVLRQPPARARAEARGAARSSRTSSPTPSTTTRSRSASSTSRTGSSPRSRRTSRRRRARRSWRPRGGSSSPSSTSTSGGSRRWPGLLAGGARAPRLLPAPHGLALHPRLRVHAADQPQAARLRRRRRDDADDLREPVRGAVPLQPAAPQVSAGAPGGAGGPKPAAA